MSLLLVALGLALVAVIRSRRRRLRLVADAAHELRGAAATLALASAAMRREPGGLRRARAFESELDRLGAALEDLDAARAGSRPSMSRPPLALERSLRTAAAGWRPVVSGQGRRLSLRWEAGTAAVRADRRRLAQVLGNLLANAVAKQLLRLAVRSRVPEHTDDRWTAHSRHRRRALRFGPRRCGSNLSSCSDPIRVRPDKL